MEIPEIKSLLTLSEVLHHYGLVPKNKMLKCFYHEDKTASLQVNLEKNYYKCHGCGKTGDVIQFIEDFEKLTKHEAIKKAENLVQSTMYKVESIKHETKDVPEITERTKTELLEKLFKTFRKSVYNSNPAQDYLRQRALDHTKIEVGYNSGQFHHGQRKDGQLIDQCLDYGLLLDKGLKNAYSVFGKWCIVFALRNKENAITGMYFRSTVNDKDSKHFYLKDRKGIYPGYPKPETKKLILTESIIDAASLLQIKEIGEKYSIVACFGTNGLNEEIQSSIKELKELEEIIFIFDNDKSGKEAAEKYANEFNIQNSTFKISFVELPNKDVNETLQLHNEEIFLELLENRKEIFLSNEKNKSTGSAIEPKTTTDFLEQKNLLQELNKLIEQSGIIGEENSRLLLFLITISYLNKSPLHGIVQGSSGSGKTHIISRIADLMPQEDVLRFTRITESSLYNWGEFDLFQKIIIIEDLDGLKEDALYALREFISNQVLRSSVTIKDKKGNNKSSHKIVKGQFSSLSATTKGELYEDNMNRSFIVAINESEEQTKKIIDYQNRKNAGKVDRDNEQKAIEFIQKVVRNLKYYEVINPFAMELQLPDKVKNKRRLNEMVQSIIKQITLLNQYQRKQTNNGKLITEIEDLEQGIEILFESIILKIDELDGSLRQFLEKLKKRFEQREFNRFEAMESTGFKKSQLQVYLNELVRLEYLKQKGFVNKGFTYKIGYSDDIQKVRQELKDHFRMIIDKLKTETSGSKTETRLVKNQLVNH